MLLSQVFWALRKQKKNENENMYSIRLVIQSIALSKISMALQFGPSLSSFVFLKPPLYKYFTFPELFLFEIYFLFVDSIDNIDSQDY